MDEERHDPDRNTFSLYRSDEIYHGLVYEGEAHSILEFYGSAFVITAFQSSMP